MKKKCMNAEHIYFPQANACDGYVYAMSCQSISFSTTTKIKLLELQLESSFPNYSPPPLSSHAELLNQCKRK